VIRHATVRDAAALARLEDRCFQTDRITTRQFRYLLTKAHAVTHVDEKNGVIRGYVVVLFHAGTSLARLYSIGIAPEYRGQGIADGLVQAAESSALADQRVYMRLEIRRDNEPSIALFRRHEYRQFGVYPDYYEDHMEALRFQKGLVARLQFEGMQVPYYPQTLDFTCGPAALMMAMKAVDGRIETNRRLEIRLWRESTTVFMTSGLGGCSPYGLALAAQRRGFSVEIYVNDRSALFIDSVRSEEKKEVIRLVQEDFMEEIKTARIPVHYRRSGVEDLEHSFSRGVVPIVLISSYRIYREKFPHWVVMSGFDERFIYVHDPYVDEAIGKTETDCVNMPILKQDFERMARYGKSAQRAVVLIGRARRRKRR
jgi:ribosomal protein S18 acetylase RimI-like enzyme/predicted double-glycine peptidase